MSFSVDALIHHIVSIVIFLDALSISYCQLSFSYHFCLQVGSVSDDELIELLDLALSSDTTNTVRRARELMASAIDPLQLVSQLANLIMDILSGRCQSAVTEVSKSFLGRYACKYPFLVNLVSDHYYCYLLQVNCMNDS